MPEPTTNASEMTLGDRGEVMLPAYVKIGPITDTPDNLAGMAQTVQAAFAMAGAGDVAVSIEYVGK